MIKNVYFYFAVFFLANMMFDCDEYGHLGKRIRISSN